MIQSRLKVPYILFNQNLGTQVSICYVLSGFDLLVASKFCLTKYKMYYWQEANFDEILSYFTYVTIFSFSIFRFNKNQLSTQQSLSKLMQQFTIQLVCIRNPKTKCYLQLRLASPFSSKQFPPMTLKSIVYCLSGENLGDIASLFFPFRVVKLSTHFTGGNDKGRNNNIRQSARVPIIYNKKLKVN